jgi:hypothetical protein
MDIEGAFSSAALSVLIITTSTTGDDGLAGKAKIRPAKRRADCFIATPLGRWRRRGKQHPVAIACAATRLT